MHSDDAYDHLVRTLANLPAPSQSGERRHRDYDCDLWLPYVIVDYWRRVQSGAPSDINSLTEHQLLPFYDAAWDLCRVGVLRPGQTTPKGQAMGAGLFSGDGYSVTAFGWRWLKEAGEHPLPDSSRLAEVLQSLGTRFGDGYRQRAGEAVRSYRTLNYLAACVMAGAAAESILLAVAITKNGGDEAKVLAQYKSQGGRGRVMAQVVGNTPAGIGSQFQSASQVMHYWRDDAGHGTFTTISEVEAHTSINQLLRLAQLTADHWEKLVA